MLKISAALIGVSTHLQACKGGKEPDIVDIATAVRADYVRGDIVLCNGFVVSRTEADYYKNQGLC